MRLIFENWRNFVKEAIIDVVADQLSNIFDQGKLKKEVVATIENGIASLKQQFPDLEILDYFISGASVTYQYSETSDIDITVVIPKDLDPQQFKQIDKWIEGNLDGKFSYEQRPYQFKVSPNTREELEHTDSAYDVAKQTWIKEPSKEEAEKQYKQFVDDPDSYENKAYSAIERSIQPALQRLARQIDAELGSGAINEDLSDKLKELIDQAYEIYSKIKAFRKKGYAGKDPRVSKRISQNWATGNIIYKFLDREGYNDVFDMVKKAYRSKYEIVDTKFLQNLKQKLSNVVGDEIGFER